jgi:hypothetical protein
MTCCLTGVLDSSYMLHGFSLADSDDVIFELNAVEPVYSLAHAAFGFHFDQRHSPARSGVPASDNHNRDDLASRGEMVIQFNLIGVVR